MKNVANTIEDLLEILAGLQGQSKIQIESSDHNLLYSLARQVFKGTGLTDRQYELSKEKLSKYADQFTALDYNFDDTIQNLKYPLREIDRSRWIKIVDSLDVDQLYESHKGPFIAVRFSFQKKLISAIEQINNKISSQPYHYDNVNKIKYYEYSEKNLYEIVSAFKDKNFILEKNVEELYDTISNFKKENHLPGIYDFKFLNLHPKCEDALIYELGNVSKDNILLFKDRSLKYGLNIDAVESSSVLTQNIANRKTPTVFVNSNKWNTDHLVNTLVELDRFPVVILLDESNPYEALVNSYNAFKNIVTPDQVSVQFRLSSENSNGFNEYIKENKLNSPVDKHSKIVYTSIDKPNKPLITSECDPKAAILLESRRLNHKMLPWLNSFDLVIHYDTDVSHFTRFQKIKLTEV